MAGKKERQRRLARERLERRAARQAQRDRRVRQWTISVLAALVVVAVAVGGALIATQSHGTKAAAAPGSSASASATPSPTPTPTPVAEPAHHCLYTAAGTAARKVSLPPATPDYKAGYRATITTNRGGIVIDLLNSKATCTVNSFISLAAQRFFNNTPCHRITTAGTLYVLQCGDPTGTGTGGPGYQFNNENLAGATYKTGTVAMANSGQPDTNGSQFFLVYRNSSLPPGYTPFGRIISGLNIIQNVALGGTDNSNGPGDGHPKRKVDIESVTITKT